MRVFLYRHAATPGNTDKKYIGVTDEPLSASGENLARAIGPDLSVQTVYTSMLARTQETARILFPSARLIALPAFNEMDFGKFEGKSFSDLSNNASYQAWIDSRCISACPGGESRDDLSRRACPAFETLISNAVDCRDLVIVTHGGVIMALMHCYARATASYFDWHVGPLGGYSICLDQNTWPSTRRFESYQAFKKGVIPPCLRS
ncbi:MAG: histidine phosphatase family protein [Oscillospiraceae bacterium]|jgi:alpha-ribazole phosphatase|nr:histidine phosphatase family protein [Oscillospiraceae bacterium]